jgi:hypothetical protein
MSDWPIDGDLDLPADPIETRDRLEREIEAHIRAIVRSDDMDEKRVLAERLASLEAQVEEFHC